MFHEMLNIYIYFSWSTFNLESNKQGQTWVIYFPQMNPNVTTKYTNTTHGLEFRGG